MIGFDFGILFSLMMSVEDLPSSSEGFRIELSVQTKDTLNRLRSTFRNSDGRLYTFASDSLGIFEPRIMDQKQLVKLVSLKRDLLGSFPIYLADKGLATKLDLTFRRSGISNLEDLPEVLKWVYYISFEPGDSPISNPIDQNNIIGLAPPILKFDKTQISQIRHVESQEQLLPTAMDDDTVQYDTSRSLPGLYEVDLLLPVVQTKRIYLDANLFQKAPLAIVEIKVEKGPFTLKEYQVKFKKRTNT